MGVPLALLRRTLESLAAQAGHPGLALRGVGTASSSTATAYAGICSRVRAMVGKGEEGGGGARGGGGGEGGARITNVPPSAPTTAAGGPPGGERGRTTSSPAAKQALAAITAGLALCVASVSSRAGARPALPPAAAATLQLLTARVPTLWKTATPEECAAACDDLLRSAVRTPFTSRRVAGLYTVELRPPFEGAPVLILTPGYGSGTGLWLFNLDELAVHYHVYAVDWLGCGASARPQWHAPSSVEAGERFFTESLEEWRVAVGLGTPFVLVGHSLGGYLSAAYALHHPGRVRHLVLVSPAGIPTPPDPELLAQSRTHWLIGLLRWAWESGVTPQSIIRALGPVGEKWASTIVSARFRRMLDSRGGGVDGTRPALDEGAFLRYLYAITVAEGSGEFALRVLLSFGAHAREPMGPRLLRAASVGEVAEEGEPGHPPHTAGAPTQLRVPITLLYGGGRDWMDDVAGAQLARDLRGRGVDAECHLVPHSGHHLYMENVEGFHALLLRRLRATGADVSRAGSRLPTAPGPDGSWPSYGAP